jgi:hypothetical protein
MNPEPKIKVIIPAKYGMNSVIYFLFISFKYIPKPMIDGTHNPTKMAASLSPLNQLNSEYTSDKKAANKIRISTMSNFFICF